MLVQLYIQDIVLIERLEIEFSSGLSVLTGETGAGKSILLDSLSLALGARGDGNLVRMGAKSGQVRAVFSLPENHTVIERLHQSDWFDSKELDIRGAGSNGSEEPVGSVEIILRRVQSSDGRTRSYINDIPVSVSQLREIGQLVVEIHGQHDDRALMDEDQHRVLLDEFGGLDHELQLVETAWKNWRSAKQELSALEKKVNKAGEEADYLRTSVAELEQLAPESGEETELADRRQQMMHAQNIAGELSEAEEILSGRNSPVPTLASLVRKLERKSAQVPGLLEEVVEQIDKSISYLYSAQNSLDEAIRKSEFDPHMLENTEERLFALRAAARKYNVAVENLPDLAVDMANQLHDLDHGEEQLARSRQKCSELQAEYDRLAALLSEKRMVAGRELIDQVHRELPSLKLDQAEFLLDHDNGPQLAGPSGQDRIEFWVRTNPGTKPGPMFKVASGGELSRFLLAIKVVLADKGSAPTLVFDEVDTGVGGAVADAIGKRLSRLSNNVQVLSVTHAPQVAARANSHFLISKSGRDGNTTEVVTEVVPIEQDTRRDEIARMLAGASITDEAKAAAERLMNDQG